MALTTGPNAGDMATKTGATGTLNLTQKTYLVWVYPTTLTASNNIFTGRSSTSGLGASLKLTGDTTGNVRLFENGTTSLDARSTGGTLTINNWYYIAGLFDFGGTPKIYVGTLTSAAAEVSYSQQTAGATKTSEVTATLTWFNQQNIQATPWQGAGACAGVYDRLLSAAEIGQHQFSWKALSGCKGLWIGNNTTTLTDLSGTGNDLTVTGATISQNPTLPFLIERNYRRRRMQESCQ